MHSVNAVAVRTSGAMTLITAGTILEPMIQFLHDRDGSPGTSSPFSKREQHGTGRCITVQTEQYFSETAPKYVARSPSTVG